MVHSMDYRKAFVGALGRLREARFEHAMKLVEKELGSRSTEMAHEGTTIQSSAGRDAVLDVEDPWQLLMWWCRCYCGSGGQ